EPVPHTGRPRAGKSEQAGAAFDPGGLRAAAPDVVEVRRPRPATTRYPIDYAEFMTLKGAAAAGESRLTKRAANLTQDRGGRRAELATAAAMDAAVGAPLPTGTAAAPAAAPAAVASFAGIPATGWLPPDCTLAAGPQHVLLSVNSSVAVYAKTGGAPLLQRTLTTWFANVLNAAMIFDPKALYDQHAGRWVLAAVALDQAANRSWFLLSVSQTPDPLGGWWNYALDAGRDGTTATQNWADYPSLGVDNQALYLTANMFRFNGGFQYPKLRIIPKTGP